ncbi:integrase [Pseudomonas oryzihabitans]|nr:site-specific integrase [Pseudomonas psychrotolerans]KTT48151.1 integrase [Pseudomonas psychrotolerans]
MFVIRRGSTYYLNVRLGSQHLRLSLGIQERRAAIFKATAIAQRVDEHRSKHPQATFSELHALCRCLVRTERLELLPSSPSLPSHSSSLPAKAKGPLLSRLAKQYVEEGKHGAWRQGQIADVERTIHDFFALMGDMEAEAFDQQQARTLKERLCRSPSYYGLRPEFKGKTLLEIVESGDQYEVITPVTINNRLRKLTSWMNWCVSNGYLQANPLSGMKVMEASAKDARLPFDQREIAALLNQASLMREARKNPWRYWLPLLARATGARLEELAQLYLDDVVEEQGILCIKIDDTRPDQKLKNPSSRRIIPIHKELIELGLIEHINNLKEKGEQRLWPELKQVRDRYGYAASKWFGTYRHKLNISDPRKTFHSFRHSFIDDLRNHGIEDSLLKDLVGHGDHGVTFAVYGKRRFIERMNEAVNILKLG